MRVSISGHRPNKLGGYDWNSKGNQKIMHGLQDILEELIVDSYNKDEPINFIVGGALGIDQMSFDILYKLKKKYNNIKIEIAVPFKDQPNVWVEKDKNRYKEQLMLADKVTYVDKGRTNEGSYSIYKMIYRNRYMIDNSDILVAVWDGSLSGTSNAIRYAKQKKKKIIIYDL